MALTDQAHTAIQQHFALNNIKKNLAVDATCGNGNDTVFLIKMGFAQVCAFDIQPIAISNTQQRLLDSDLTQEQINSAQLILDGHQNCQKYLSASVDCFVFNLGFLPKADKQITTSSEHTLQALNYAVEHLSDNGIISLLCYPGHRAGKIETLQVQQWLSNLPENWQLTQIDSNKPSETTPVLYFLTH